MEKETNISTNITNIKSVEFDNSGKGISETVVVGDCGKCGARVIYQTNGWPKECPSCKTTLT